MKVRHIKRGHIGFASDFNIHAGSPGEMIVYFEDNSLDSDYCKDYEVWINALNEWKPFYDAMRDSDIVTNNFNTHFFEPSNKEDRERGYTLD